MDHSSLGKLPLDILRIIWDLVSTRPPKANPTSFDCGHTAHGARDPTSKRLDNTLLRCCRELYHCGSMVLYGGRDLKFHEPWCFRRFIHSLSGPLPLQLANSVEIHLKRKYRNYTVSTNTTRREEQRFVSEIAENIRDTLGQRPVFNIDAVAEDTFCYTNVGSYVRVIITFNRSGTQSEEPRRPQKVIVEDVGLAL